MFRFLFVILLSVQLPLHALTLQACKLDEDYAPHSFPNCEAPGERLIKMAVAAQGDDVEFTASPWPRCLEGIRHGEYDLIVGPSPDPKFFSFIAYPFIDGVPDPEKSLGPVDYMLLKRVDNPVSWDGLTFKNLTSPVFYGDHAVIIRTRLDALGVPSDDSAIEMNQLLNMLFHDRTDLIIMRRYEAMSQIAQVPYRGAVEMLPLPIVSFNSYLGVSLQRLKQDPSYVEAIWAELKNIRQSDEWPILFDEIMASTEGN